MEYEAIELVTFKKRENRFIATCLKDNGEEITTHVKNTGRCKELLIPGVKVAVNYQDKITRKTKYDLVSVEKEGAWFNIDSQLPNALVEEALKQKKLNFDIIQGEVTSYKREYTYGDSRFDFLLETSQNEKVLLEVKGMTLESQGVGSFPDAPSTRALKHVKGLIEAQQAGFKTAVLFVAQFEKIRYGTINRQMQPDLAETIKQGMQSGLEVLVYNCVVTPREVTIKEEIPFKLT